MVGEYLRLIVPANTTNVYISKSYTFKNFCNYIYSIDSLCGNKISSNINLRLSLINNNFGFFDGYFFDTLNLNRYIIGEKIKTKEINTELIIEDMVPLSSDNEIDFLIVYN